MLASAPPASIRANDPRRARRHGRRAGRPRSCSEPIRTLGDSRVPARRPAAWPERAEAARDHRAVRGDRFRRAARDRLPALFPRPRVHARPARTSARRSYLTADLRLSCSAEIAARSAVGDVSARPAGQEIAPALAEELVVPLAAVDRVGSGVARERVREVAADHILDALEPVATEPARARAREIDVHLPGRVGEVDDVAAAAAVEGVVPGPAAEEIVAASAEDRVVSRPAIEEVDAAIALDRVGVRRAEDAVHVDERVGAEAAV